MRFVFALFLALLVAAPPVSAQGDVPEATLLDWTARVGRMLHGYHSALGVATAAVNGRADRPPLYAGGPYNDGWAFSFGELEGDSAFVIRYGVIVDGDGGVVRFDEFDERRLASSYHTLAARALAVVRADFDRFRGGGGFTAEAYRYAVLPFPRGRMTAFVSPAQTQPGLTLMGNDVMYTLDRSDVRASNPTRFHHRLIPLPTTPPAEGMAALLVPEAPLPSPVDVLHAMERGAPLAVAASRGEYVIAPNGVITPLDPNDPLAEALRRGVEEEQ